MRFPASVWVRFALVLPLFAVVIALLVWRGPDWNLVADAFQLVTWEWIAAAVLLNLVSVGFRALAWRAVIEQAMPPPLPAFRRVFSAFSVGLFANTVLPGRIGELARVAVLSRRVEGRRQAWATLAGTVFAHRVFDLVPTLLLIAYVLATSEIPHWALTSLALFVAIAFGLFAFAFASARRHHRGMLAEAGQVRRLVTMARHGLGVMHAPLPALGAILLQCLGWGVQLLAVYATMRGFQIEAPLHAAAVVLLLMNVAMLFPLWPGNIGLVQAAVALPLVSYGVAYPRGFAFGIGLLFLAREGLSYAMLKRMPGAEQAEVAEEGDAEREEEPARARAGVSG